MQPKFTKPTVELSTLFFFSFSPDNSDMQPSLKTTALQKLDIPPTKQRLLWKLKQQNEEVASGGIIRIELMRKEAEA